ncbi:MAG: tRNA (adenosine(37)-N6)-threonylcarbamoyltransferase complex ATPase subunit type 1 TsaE [Phycisphaeraceae bacterium]
MTSFTLTAAGPSDTDAIARGVAGVLRVGDLVGLTGELGAGKTHFVRGLAAGLGLDPRQVSSPTFILLHEYTSPAATHPATSPNQPSAISPQPSSPVLMHLDVYRLAVADELETLGWGESGEELREAAVVAVEWADRVREAMGGDWLEVALEHAEDGGRVVTFLPHGAWGERMGELRAAVG